MIAAVAVSMTAAVLDAVFGEPRRFHPLVGFGRLAGYVEQRLYGPAGLSAPARRWRGVAALVVLLLPATGLAALVPGGWVGILFELLVLYLALGANSLAAHARAVYVTLARGELEAARAAVARLVSRDTAHLDESAVARAAVESVLENGNDAVFAALFWYVLGGAPAVVCYRLANTLDAMWGYRNERYRDFGWAAARLDDVLNYLPARLTALTYTLLGDGRIAWRAWRTQARLWKSPNAGPVMAAGAGALGVVLGGPASYHGVVELRPPLGAGRPVCPADIPRAVQLVRFGLGLWLIMILFLAAIHELL